MARHADEYSNSITPGLSGTVGENMPVGLALDRAQFDNLLAMADGKTRSELVLYLREDLARLADGLASTLSAPEPDSELVRAQSHVLISLSGSIGAQLLHHYALELNWAAQDEEIADMRRIADRALEQLSLLIDFLRTMNPSLSARQ